MADLVERKEIYEGSLLAIFEVESGDYILSLGSDTLYEILEVWNGKKVRLTIELIGDTDE